ncbi:MAG TPA: hypothetical protein VKE88_03455 [Candidatus Nanoarchaeia archaeon]|nr:hypothetical protein [Candidatus Nanoarchaeia archaeon]
MSKTEVNPVMLNASQFYSNVFRPEVNTIVFAETNHLDISSMQSGMNLLREARKLQRPVRILTEHFSPRLLNGVRDTQQLHDLVLGNHPETAYNKGGTVSGDLFLPFLETAFNAGELVSYGCNGDSNSFKHTGLPRILKRLMQESNKLNIAFIGEIHLDSEEESMLRILPPNKECVYLTHKGFGSSITQIGEHRYEIHGILR